MNTVEHGIEMAGGVNAEQLFRSARLRREAEETAEERRQRQKEEAQRIGEEGWEERAGFKTAEVIALEDAIEHFGFAADGSQVVDLRNPKLAYKFSDWANLCAGSQVVDMASGKPRRRAVASVWKEHLDRKTAHALTFHPGKGPVCPDPKGVDCFNKWRPIVRWEGGGPQAQVFVDHVHELFGEEADRFLDWLAHIEQQPGVLPHTAWLHIADKTGTGRNWISSVLARVWAGYVASNFDLVGMLESGFNDRLECKLLAQVDEIREGGREMWAHHEKLKSALNPEFREINPKYGRKHVEHNVCRWLIFSNSILAIPLTDSDRRVEVVHYRGQPKTADYYARLYALLDDRQFINAVGIWLRERDIHGFNPGARAKHTAARAALIRANESDAKRRIECIVQHWPLPWISSTQLRGLLFDEDERNNRRLSAHAKATLKDKGAKPITESRRRIADELTDIWQIREPDPGVYGEAPTLKDAVAAIEALYEKEGMAQLGHDWSHWSDILAEAMDRAREAQEAVNEKYH